MNPTTQNRQPSDQLLTTDLPHIPGGWTDRDITVTDRVFHLTVPATPDAFLDDASVIERNHHDDYMPYWPYLWPAARDMAQAILLHDWNPASALEIGAGIGLVGLAAASKGLQVTFSDYDPTAVALTRHNAWQNGFRNTRSITLDWRDRTISTTQIVLGCDVVYDVHDHAMILGFLKTVLAPDGLCWIGDPGRQHASEFRDRAIENGFHVDVLDRNGQLLPDHSRMDPFQVGQFRIVRLRRHA